MKKSFITLLLLHLLVGLNGLGGGYYGISNPNNEVLVEMLKRGPFDNVLIPSIFLIVVIGLGNLVLMGLAIKKNKYQAYGSGTMGGILILWIIIQCWVMKDINPLHITIFICGIVMGMISIYMAFKNKLFPAPFITKFVQTKVIKKTA